VDHACRTEELPADDGVPVVGGRIGWPRHRALRVRATGWGAFAALLLIVVYVAVLALANSLEHALDEFVRLWYWMVPLILGFSLQVGLFAYARRATRGTHETHARGVVASGGASTLSMIACCAHHITDVLPVLGLAGAVTLLAAYQNVFLLLGVLSNLLGLLYVLGLLRRHRLYPDRRSALSLALRWPVDRSLPFAIPIAIAILAAFYLRVAA